MKYIKTFENKEKFIKMTDKNKLNRNIYYYLLYVDSIEKFDFALDKIGIKDDFYDDIWGAQVNIDEYIIPKLEKDKKIYLSVDYFIENFDVFNHEPSDEKLVSLRDDNDRKCKIIYGGEISVYDYEIIANKFNL